MWPFNRNRQPLPELTSAAEFEDEARAEMPLPNFWGWHDAGVFNPGQVNRRWQRYREWYGVEVIPWREWLPWLFMLAIGAAAGFVMYGVTAESNLRRVQTTSPVAGAVIGLVVPVACGVVPIQAWVLTRRYYKVYRPLTLWERSQEVTGEMIEGSRFFVDSLCFIQPHTSGKQWFRAPTRKSAQLEGAVHLWWPEGESLLDWDGDVDRIFELEPAEFGINEVAASLYYSEIEEYVENGEANRLARFGAGWQFFNENWPWLLSGLMLLGIVIVTQSGNQ